jgi:ribonucleoside-diphosphate reductase alpha chain
MSTLNIKHHFTTPSTDPLADVKWEARDAILKNFKGETIFEQKGILAPADWSVTAVNIVASKYFHGKLDTPERENTIAALILRVVNAIIQAGLKQGVFASQDQADIFAKELTYLLVNQYGAFNSPVWFNVGCDRLEPNSEAASWHWNAESEQIIYETTGYRNPQCSACFINSVEDSMEGIMRLAHTEAMLFKFGSGTGTNFSTLRSSKESVTGGGVASGPLSFMKGLDAFAGVIKSGGKTRRAAKMAILDVGHPDIVDFIECKLLEDKKAQALMREGYDGTSGPDSEAYSSVFYQNANNSVRVSDEFMQSVVKDEAFTTHGVRDGMPKETFEARDLMRKISEATWFCGDPGMQYDDTINSWHTCKNTARINASNPCSEYMFLDDSACNLASLNLLKFLQNGIFNVHDFRQAIKIFIIAQEILVDLSGYPTEKIAKNSHDYRPLGLGYANLGALLMARGLPYDSDEGRLYAAAITSIMTGQAYYTSAKLASGLSPLTPANTKLAVPAPAERTGAAPGFFTNREPFLDVIRKHKDAALAMFKDFPDHMQADLFQAACTVWNNALSHGEKYGYRNCQVTVLAPTGTIGFMMDCDTTGIEPELALVKFKKLVGGGSLKIVNDTVTRALENLGYSAADVFNIRSWIEEKGTVEGSLLKDGDLPVFDCSFKAANGTRTIHYSGHIGMMAATQPFLSGAISKTVNLPNDATVEDIMQAYIDAWKQGVKAVAIYRDGSKSNQVLVTKKEEVKPVVLDAGSPSLEGFLKAVDTLATAPEGEENMDAPPRSVRHRLPETRSAINHKFSIAGHDGYLNVGLYKNGQPGEIFITMAKEGSTLSGLMDCFALVFSIALQHGVPLETLTQKLAHSRFEPSGWTGNSTIGYAKSIMDYIARWLESKFLKLPGDDELIAAARAITEAEDAPIASSSARSLSSMVGFSDAPSCQTCGDIMVRNGSCYKCTNCGGTSGCS